MRYDPRMEQRIEPLRNLFSLTLATIRQLRAAAPESPAFARLHGLVGGLAEHYGFGDAGDDFPDESMEAFTTALADPALSEQPLLRARLLMAAGDALLETSEANFLARQTAERFAA